MTAVFAVFDTNVIVSGLISPQGTCGRVCDWLRQKDIQAVVDQRILAEYMHVLPRPRFGLSAYDVETFLAVVMADALMVSVGPHDAVEGLPDASDAPFLECAIKAGCALVTGNLKHFPARCRRGIRVLTPAEFVSLSFR